MKNVSKFFILIVLFLLSTYFVKALPSSWNYTITFNSHVILIQPSTQLSIDGVQIEIGDYIGVFYSNTSGGLSCGGYMQYQGVMNSINAWTEDLGNDGFSSGDVIVWKIWDSSANMECIAEAEYDLSGSFTNAGIFSENGMSGLISLSASCNIVPWNFNITGSNHSLLIPASAIISINGSPISHGDYLGVFYDSSGVLACGGYVEWLGFTTSISAWGVDIGNDGFVNGEEFLWKIWDKSENEELISHPYYMGLPMPNQGEFTINGMSGIDSIKYIAPPWNYTITATNHTILIPETGTYLLNNIPISIGDYIGVFYDSIGNLTCGGYALWEGYNTSIAAWGEDLGWDGFVLGEEFKWKVWDSSEGIEYFASAVYMGSPLPNQGEFVVNGMSGVDSLLIMDYPPNWNYTITGNNHTILIPDFGDYSTLNGPIDAGDFIGVFYDSLGTTTCAGYAQWFGILTTIAAWGADSGNDGFQNGEEFTWKIWDTSAGMEFEVVATYMQPPLMPNTNLFYTNGMSGILSLQVFEPTPPWDYINTGSNHSILIPDNINILIDNIQIEAGDYIGVFYDSLGTLVCAGYAEYTGSTLAVTAWGEDIGLDGFTTGEEFNWMVWDASDDTIWQVYAEYDQTFPQQEFYIFNGISSLTNITSSLPIEIQEIPLNQGWGIYSTYVDPFYPEMDSVFADIVQNTIMVKNADGFIFWPDFNVNLIGSLAIGEGYLIKMTIPQTLTVVGDLILPAINGIYLNPGWDMISYMRKTPSAISIIMDPILSSIELVKDGDGNIFWPQYFLNLIGNMYPGRGYQIKMNSSATLFYPPNSENLSKADFNETPILDEICNTGINMSLCIPVSVLPINFTGFNIKEIGIYDKQGLCVGKTSLLDGSLAMSIWGDDLLTEIKDGLSEGEEFSIITDNGIIINVENWKTGSGTYENNKISVAGKINIVSNEPSFGIKGIYPNPVTSESVIEYFIPEDGELVIQIYNILGEIISTEIRENQSLGKHTLQVDKNDLPMGRYLIKLIFKGQIKSAIFDIL